ncbi:aminotransferase class III-fold pyridoxal phosphate-dependent enzyme [Streptococcus ratti]|uniref:Aminotransferase n=1 Tax=Streptococcus ratti FA-1 = DSM 20564 TaxID=699248 RepID=A0ABN0GRT2_STRRT|nr:aminotransferase class III-fold pyridoxal phosphate-dependent enzyme [Streptococcus ratti]EJN93176.1 putative aminotransferase [Streptococcus ratti FA-1 = DSM 20564]EMP70099.1 aminotransferase [Streptococcus ratti FA-1 = DSM 20564]QEY06855.1 aminotransferase class III-fold pyridoxal phosphate-dependent enzyme [Streptococcus ratti]VEI59269.1 aminotransferase [Streptococcus mutans]
MKHYALLNGAYGNETMYDFKPVKADSTYLYDSQNRKYLDLRSGLWNTSLGYIDSLYQRVSKRFDQVLSEKLPYLDIHSFQHNIYDEVAQKILELTGQDFKRVLYTNSGSENTELALKIADYTNKKGQQNRILAFKDSYHGTFFGGISVSGIDQGINSSFYPKYGEVTFIDYPKSVTEEKDTLDYIAKVASSYDVMMIEPILASAGVYFASTEFFNALLKLLRENQVLIVFDEVATGFFKTGTPFYFQQLSESPDVLCLSKAINNGIVPFGCVCVNKEVDGKLQQNPRVMEHFSTQNGNLLGLESANIVLDYYIKSRQVIERKIKDISDEISNILDSRNLSYRNKGIMTAVRTESNQSLPIMKSLEKLGILTYLYINEAEEGLSIMPQININLSVLEKALKLISKKIESQTSF